MKTKIMCACLLSVCAMAGSAESEGQSLKGKYEISYEWSSGPIVGHYQYLIEIAPSGNGKIVMVPGYQTIYDTEIPKWREDFSVSDERLEAVYDFIDENKVLSSDWKSKGLVMNPKGGSYCMRMNFRVPNRESYSIPCNPWQIDWKFEGQQKKLKTLIDQLVPKEVHDHLFEHVRKYQCELESSLSNRLENRSSRREDCTQENN